MKRRQILKHLSLWAVGAPVLSALRVRAGEQQSIRRLVVVFSPNGPQFVQGPTEGTEHDFSLHPWWSPLARHIHHGFFFRRLHQAGVRFGESSEYGHRSGTVGALTATTTGPRGHLAQGPSIDQFVARGLHERGVITPKRSLLFSLEEEASAFYEAAGQRATPIVDPYEALAEIAPAFSDEIGDVEQRLKQRRRILNVHAGDCSRLRQEVGGRGREILDFHCENVDALTRSVESSLEEGFRACSEPSEPPIARPEGTLWTDPELRDDAFDAYANLTSLAFLCDITRVVGISLGKGASRFALPARYGVPESGTVNSGDSGPQMHAWTHQPESHPDTMPALEIFHHWFSTKVAHLLDTLASTLDLDGRPLLETTAVLWTSEFGAGGYHSNDHVPVMLFGGSEGRWTPGRHFEADGTREERSLPLHALFVSLARHMRLDDVDTFGNAGSGPLEWLEG